jgi:pilus assembly protein CpaB
VSRRLLFFLFTAVLAVSAALLVRNALKSKEARIAALSQNTVRIVVAARALNPGDVIDVAAVRLTSWPRDNVPPGAFTEPQMLAGRVARQTVSIDQPIVASAVLEAEKTGGVLPLLIPPGMRAMSIPVDDVSDLSGFVLPHSRVDVLVSVPVSGGPASQSLPIGQITKIVLQNIEVLAVAQTLEAGPDQPHEAKVVTLLVSPADSERLGAAARLGTLTLAMRNFADRERLATGGVSVPTLLDGVSLLPEFAPPPAQAAARAARYAPRPPRPKVIEVIRNGTEHQTVDFLAGRRIGSEISAPPPAMDGSVAAAPNP